MEFEDATQCLIRDGGVESRTDACTRVCGMCVSPMKYECFATSCKVIQKLANWVAFSNSNFLSNRHFFLMVFWRETFVELEKVVLEGCMGTVKKVGRYMVCGFMIFICFGFAGSQILGLLGFSCWSASRPLGFSASRLLGVLRFCFAGSRGARVLRFSGTPPRI